MGCAKGIRGIFHDGKPMDAPTSPGASSRFSLRAFDHVLLFSTPWAQKEGFWEGFSIPCGSALAGHRGGDTAMSPNSAHPQRCHPISPKTGMSRSGGKPLLEQPHDPTTRKSRELPRPRGFPAFPALPRPPLEQRENYNPLLLNSTRALK